MKPPITNYYIGLDLSLTSTGICVASPMRNGKLRVLKCDSVRPRKLEGTERLARIEDEIMGHLSVPIGLRRQGRALVHLAIEGYSFSSKFSRAHAAGELGGVVRVALWKAGILHPYIVPPSTLKKFVTGEGNAEKKDMIAHVEKLWKLKTEDDNEADAFALAMFAGALSGSTSCRVLFRQEEVLRNYRKTCR